MATFPLHERHNREREHATRCQARITTTTTTTPNNPTASAGDHTYRIPTIGLNPGHLPGTRPDLAWYNHPNTAPAA